MISEAQQEQTALYTLGLLDAEEAAEFERQVGADAELRDFEHELRESIALLALAGESWTANAPPPALRGKIMAEAAAEQTAGPMTGRRETARARVAWLPWALAALLMGCTGGLTWLVQNQQQRLVYFGHQLEQGKPTPPTDTLMQVSFCALEPTPEFTTAQPRAAVLWDAAHRQGKLRVNRLAPPAEGKDYQLWTVEAGRKGTISAGVFHVGADGTADVSFQPVETDGKPVVAVAISLEQAGGSPTNRGPVLLLGKF